MSLLPRVMRCVKHFYLDRNFSKVTDNTGQLKKQNFIPWVGENVKSAIPFVAELHA